MKLRKITAITLAGAMAAATLGMTAMAADTDWKSFKIDPAQIPQEKLDTTISVACSIRGLENPYINTIKVGMEMFCEYLDSIGQKYEMQVLDSGGSNDTEINNMKQFAAKANGNAIAYSDPNESAICTSLVEAMAESGGYIGTAWNREEEDTVEDYNPNWVIHTSPDNVANGKAIASALFDQMGGKGQILVVEGMLGNTANNDRVKGLEEALAEYPDIEVAAQDTANWATADALTLVETWLNQYPDVGGIWCANDNMATGAMQALENAGLLGKVGVVGIDANNDVVDAIKAGNATATVSSNGYLQGGYTLAICYAAWAGLIDPEELPLEYREFATPATVITSENVDEYIASYIDATPEFDFSEIFWCKAD
ncbi:MAG: sugar ABC transporter substrate-binding protein [Lachnospiraceae bacterium]|nr:sugar ABC transporter substrate-binding protein [Lachnospiraceae bacterium]MDD3794386.1 sugar ABC transporter substrate-binding protein [Lachnospiraceae bacterium]